MTYARLQSFLQKKKMIKTQSQLTSVGASQQFTTSDFLTSVRKKNFDVKTFCFVFCGQTVVTPS